MSNQPLSAEGVACPRDVSTEAKDSRRPATLAFHFRYVMREQFISDHAVAADRLARVLRGIRPGLAESGVLSMRMGKLFYTHQLRTSLEVGWWQALQSTRVVEGKTTLRTNLDSVVPLDRMFVVSVTGDVSDRLDAWSQRVEAVAGDRFLFACEPVQSAHAHRQIYFGANAWLIGELHGSSRWEPQWEAVEFGPELGPRLRRMGLEVPDYYADPAAEEARFMAHLRERCPELFVERQQATESIVTQESRNDT